MSAAKGAGEHCKLPQWGPGETMAANKQSNNQSINQKL